MGTRDTLVLNVEITSDFGEKLLREIKDVEINGGSSTSAHSRILFDLEDNLNYSKTEVHRGIYSSDGVNDDFMLLTVNVRMKNYESEFEKFIEYINPHVVGMFGEEISNVAGFILHDDGKGTNIIRVKGNRIIVEKERI